MDECLAEIRFAIKEGMKVRFFSAEKKYDDIKELKVEEIIFVEEVLEHNNRTNLIKELTNY